MRTVGELTVMFFLFACVGWILEVTLKYIQFGRFINRGFLIGPYCPIYGWGVVAVTVLVGGLIGREGTIWETFLAGFVICGALEYFTSWYMEKLFHARWWDYSHKPMNLNGRIWIGNLILFGIASVLIVWLIDPLFFAMAETWQDWVVYTAAGGIWAVMLADHIVSHILMNLVRREIDAQTGDSTEEISRQVHALLRDKGMLIRRIQSAYPEWQARPRHLKQRLHQVKRQLQNARRQANRRLREAARGRGAQAEAQFREALAARRKAVEKLRELEHRFWEKN